MTKHKIKLKMLKKKVCDFRWWSERLGFLYCEHRKFSRFITQVHAQNIIFEISLTTEIKMEVCSPDKAEF